MKEKTVYICEHCDAEYDTVPEAVKCECHGNNIETLNEIIEFFCEQPDDMHGWIILKHNKSRTYLMVYPNNICVHKKVTDSTNSCFDSYIKIETENETYEFDGNDDTYKIIGHLSLEQVYDTYNIIPNMECLEKLTSIKIKSSFEGH